MSLHLLRQLLLPIDPNREHLALAVLRDFLDRSGVPLDDSQVWLDSQLSAWRETGEASAELCELGEAVLYESSNEPAWQFSGYYFGIHQKLTSKANSIGWAEARELLSQVRLIADLALKHRKSAARIARVLASDEVLAARYSRAIDPILDAIGYARSLDAASVTQLMLDDQTRATAFFADSTIVGSAESAELLARRIGATIELGTLLKALATDNAVSFGPYLQMLHFMLVCTEFYDHFQKEAYEFNPRGAVAEMIFARHPASLKVGNPFLNNAKSVRLLDHGWAESKDANLEASRALAKLINLLDGLSYPARQEVACIIRAWLEKVFDLYAASTVILPTALQAENIQAFCDSVSNEPTRTGGVVEQRLLDLFVVSEYPLGSWIRTGIGDSVNATNISRRKCGDVEAVSLSSATLHAFESHAGTLSQPYVTEHLRTLGRVLAAREPDLVVRASAPDWDLRLTFVAHEFAGDLQSEALIGELWRVGISYITFADLSKQIDGLADWPGRLNDFVEHVLPVLQSRTTPNSVRAKLLSVLAI